MRIFILLANWFIVICERRNNFVVLSVIHAFLACIFNTEFLQPTSSHIFGWQAQILYSVFHKQITLLISCLATIWTYLLILKLYRRATIYRWILIWYMKGSTLNMKLCQVNLIAAIFWSAAKYLGFLQLAFIVHFLGHWQIP